jgi:lactoylglutathione lyase
MAGADYWVRDEDELHPRFLHTMIRVRDLERSLRFYVDGLGMSVLDRFEVESRRATSLFVGFENYRESALIEITHKWDMAEPPVHGSAYGHVALGVPDLRATVDRLASAGFEIIDPPQTMISRGPLVSFVRDPDGFAVELIQLQRREESPAA